MKPMTPRHHGLLTIAMTLGLALAPAAFASPDQSGDKFGMMDSNGDGSVSAEEHAAGANAMFNAMDANKDGNVSAAEMDAGRKGESGGMSSTDKIATIDTNGDGQLSAAEHAAGSIEMFGEADADKNGSLTAAEMQAAHDAKMGKTPN